MLEDQPPDQVFVYVFACCLFYDVLYAGLSGPWAGTLSQHVPLNSNQEHLATATLLLLPALQLLLLLPIITWRCMGQKSGMRFQGQEASSLNGNLSSGSLES